VPWQNGTCVKRVTKDAVGTLHINANRRLAIVCLSLPVHHPKFESRASRAIEISGFRNVFTSIKIIRYEERQCVNRRKTAIRVLV
jgi:hypothetical protein